MRPTKFQLRIIEWTVATVVLVVLGWLLLNTHSVDPAEMARRREVAKACLMVMHSSLTNTLDIDPDDPRIPDLIKALQPVHIEVTGTDVVIMRTGNPEEYHLSKSPDDSEAWILYSAGGDTGPEHRELIRIRND